VITVDDKEYYINYPEKVWKKYPDKLKGMLLDNISYLTTMHLPLMFDKKEINYETAKPFFESFFYKMMINNIPFTSDADSVSSIEKIKHYMNTEYHFKDKSIKVPEHKEYRQKYNEQATVNFSFGKDSLLSYAVCKEIGLNPVLVYVNDEDTAIENEYKAKSAKKFYKEFKTKVNRIDSSVQLLHDFKYFRIPRTEWGYGHLITEFSMEILPFAHYNKTKYLVFGNEKSCNDEYFNNEGIKSFPSYDQTHEWMKQLELMTKTMTNNKVHVMSVLEPINEIAIVKILHTRYKEIGKYQMSCFPDDNPGGKENAWCQDCSKCARIFVLMKANNIDPKTIGFTKNMFDKEFMHTFPIFQRSEAMVGYDKAGTGKDEQKLAFYMSYKNGAKGYLIDKFKELYLDEMKERFDELHKKFFSVYDSITIPKEIKEKVISIYKEELKA
jgi:hypothetical protein